MWLFCVELHQVFHSQLKHNDKVWSTVFSLDGQLPKWCKEWREKTEKHVSVEKKHARKESKPQPLLVLLPVKKAAISAVSLGEYGYTFAVSLGSAWKDNISLALFKGWESV